MPWNEQTVHEAFEKQHAFFRTNKTLDVDWRIEQLKKLRGAILANEELLTKALNEDLARDPAEAFFCDIGDSLMEVNECIRKVKKWARPERHFSGFLCFPSTRTVVNKMPYGVSLIISPFNFPVYLAFAPLAAALAGGNTAIIKTSSKSKACTEAMQKIIGETFPSEYVTVIDGGHDVADLCLAERSDKIFYTGSPRVGMHVMENASRNLTPVTLELGGETGNWCVVRKDADLRDAARKIAFFKILNAGQICININQVAVADEIAEEFLGYLKAEFVRQIGENAASNPEYPRLIGKAAYDKCASEAEMYRDRIVFGGTGNPETCKYNPTILYPIDITENIVNHELFSPLLPVVPFKDSEADALMATIAGREHGLALYLFTKDLAWADRTMASQQFGGGCINEVCLHLMVKGVPFGGTGHSGLGCYHGEWGFREFTHPCTVLTGKTRWNLPLREHPYNGPGTGYKKKAFHFFER